jgi:hypothetical protein
VDNIRDEQLVTMSGWQEEPLAGDTVRPPSRIGSSLAWLSRALAQCVSNCLQAVMGVCYSGLGCLTQACRLTRNQG